MKMLLSESFKRFKISRQKKGVNERYIKSIEYIMSNTLSNYMDKKITFLKTTHLQSAINLMNAKGITPSSQKKFLTIVSSWLNFELLWGSGLDPYMVKRVNTTRVFDIADIKYTEEEIKKLVDLIFKIECDVYRCFILFLFHGRRLSEVQTLKWQDVNIKKRTYVIKAENNKVKIDQTHFLTDDLITALSCIGINNNGYIFIKLNELIRLHAVRYFFKKMLKINNLPNFRMHDFRHLIGNTLASNGETLESIASVLGHTSTVTTQRYSKVSLNSSARTLKSFLTLRR